MDIRDSHQELEENNPRNGIMANGIRSQTATTEVGITREIRNKTDVLKSTL